MRKFFLLILICFLCFSSSSCRRSSTPILKNHRYKVELYNIEAKSFEEASNKEFKPIWKYTGHFIGSVKVEACTQEDCKMIFVTDPLFDYGIKPELTSYDEYYTDLVAINAESGKEIWRYRIENANISKVLCCGDFVFIGTTVAFFHIEPHYHLFCISKTNGEEKWRCQLNGVLESDLVLYQEKLYFGVFTYNDQFIYEVDAKNGEILFQYLLPAFVNLTYPGKLVIHDDHLYFSDMAEAVIYRFSIETKNIQEIWKLTTQNMDKKMTEIEYNESTLLFGTWQDQEQIEEKYYTSLFAIDIPEPTPLVPSWFAGVMNEKYDYPKKVSVDDNNIFLLTNSSLLCIDQKNKKSKWSFSVENHRIPDFFYDNDTVYITLEQSSFDVGRPDPFTLRYLIALDSKTGEIQWKLQKGLNLWGTYDHHLMVSDGKTLFLLNPNE